MQLDAGRAEVLLKGMSETPDWIPATALTGWSQTLNAEARQTILLQFANQ